MICVTGSLPGGTANVCSKRRVRGGSPRAIELLDVHLSPLNQRLNGRQGMGSSGRF